MREKCWDGKRVLSQDSHLEKMKSIRKVNDKIDKEIKAVLI